MTAIHQDKQKTVVVCQSKTNDTRKKQKLNARGKKRRRKTNMSTISFFFDNLQSIYTYMYIYIYIYKTEQKLNK